MKQILFFILISFAAFAQPKVPYGTTGDVSANSDMWLRYNFSERKYDLFFRDISDFTSSASDSVIVSGTARFKRLIPASSLISAISANIPITYNQTTGIIDINYDSLYKTTDTRYFRLSGTNVNIAGKYMIGNAPIVDRNGNFSRMLSSDSVAIFQGGNASDRQNIYRNTTHLFQNHLGTNTYANLSSTALSMFGGNASINSIGVGYFAGRVGIARSPTVSNRLEVAGNVFIDGIINTDKPLGIGTTSRSTQHLLTVGTPSNTVAGTYAHNIILGFKEELGSKFSGIRFDGGDGSSWGTVSNIGGDMFMNGLKKITIGGFDNGDSTLIVGQKGVYVRSTTGDIRFATVGTGFGTSRLIIKNNGLVGIGRIAPTYRLDIAGSMRADSSAYLATIAANRVGIGNTSASYKLDITGDLRTTTSAYFATASGSVGIGTAAPLTTLHVRSDANYSGIIRVDAINTNKQAAITYSEAGNIKYSMGKNTDNTFFLYDNTNARDLISGTTTGNLTFVPIAGRVGIGTANPAASAALDIKSTTGALIVPRMTTAQRNALTPVSGMIIYNTTLDKLQCYIAASWDSLH